MQFFPIVSYRVEHSFVIAGPKCFSSMEVTLGTCTPPAWQLLFSVSQNYKRPLSPPGTLWVFCSLWAGTGELCVGATKPRKIRLDWLCFAGVPGLKTAHPERFGVPCALLSQQCNPISTAKSQIGPWAFWGWNKQNTPRYRAMPHFNS